MTKYPRLSRPRRDRARLGGRRAGGCALRVGTRRLRPPHHRGGLREEAGRLGPDDLWVYEGALSFATTICSSHRDSPYERE